MACHAMRCHVHPPSRSTTDETDWLRSSSTSDSSNRSSKPAICRRLRPGNRGWCRRLVAPRTLGVGECDPVGIWSCAALRWGSAGMIGGFPRFLASTSLAEESERRRTSVKFCSPGVAVRHPRPILLQVVSVVVNCYFSRMAGPGPICHDKLFAPPIDPPCHANAVP